jgi:hypothetical protein
MEEGKNDIQGQQKYVQRSTTHICRGSNQISKLAEASSRGNSEQSAENETVYMILQGMHRASTEAIRGSG